MKYSQSLPGDLRVGDLLAIPCRGTLTTAEVSPFEADPFEADSFEADPFEVTATDGTRAECAGGCVDLGQIGLGRWSDEVHRTPDITLGERWLARLG